MLPRLRERLASEGPAVDIATRRETRYKPQRLEDGQIDVALAPITSSTVLVFARKACMKKILYASCAPDTLGFEESVCLSMSTALRAMRCRRPSKNRAASSMMPLRRRAGRDGWP